MEDAMGGASIRADIGMPIRDAIEAIAETEVNAASVSRAVMAANAVRDAARAVVIATAEASAGVIRSDASGLQSVATTRLVRKAKAIAARAIALRAIAARAIAARAGAAKVAVVKVAAAMDTATAGIPTGPMGVAWTQAIVPPATPTATTIAEIASTQRQPAQRVIPEPTVRTAAASGQHTGKLVANVVTESSAVADVGVVGADAGAVVARETA
jgi:hypothetical protein